MDEIRMFHVAEAAAICTPTPKGIHVATRLSITYCHTKIGIFNVMTVSRDAKQCGVVRRDDDFVSGISI